MVCSVRTACATVGCRKAATTFCRFPITRQGRQSYCNRPMCSTCAKGGRHCPPHARIAPEALITICSACLTASCPSGDMVCAAPGPRRQVTRAVYLNILSFGIL